MGIQDMDIEGIKSDFLSMWTAFVEAIVRFWNNRFQLKNEEIIYLRQQIERLEFERKQLTERLMVPQFVETKEDEEEKTFEPLTTNRYIPWHERRRKLEQASRAEAIRLQQEAATQVERDNNPGRAQTIQELEDQLLKD